MSDETHRKLAAVICADVVGYSRLMGVDEIGTLSAMRAHRQELWDPLAKRYGGRIVGAAGDSFLVEFASAVAAVETAIAVQQGMAGRNVDLPDDKKMLLRLGINIGEIIVNDDGIFGDGVNIAARMQEVAKPGGLSISDKVRTEVAGRLDVEFIDEGDHEVKNIAKPVRVWRWISEGSEPQKKPGSIKAMTQVPASADMPSIAVLPFDNMSGDPEQEFFTDGITEDIITELSRFRDLLVISRTSSFAVKGKTRNVPEIAKDLGAKFIVEGSVRKAGNRIRITVQLIDAELDRHIWAERYDRNYDDIFDIQDEVTQTIASIVPGRVAAATRELADRKPPENMAAYEFVLAGKVLHHQSNRESNDKAVAMLDKAIDLDPNYAHAHAWRACTLGQAWAYGYCEDPEATVALIGKELETAIRLDENDSDVHRILASLKLVYRDFEAAVYHQERALALNPNDDLIVVQQGEILTWIGKPEEGIPWINKAMRLNPYHPERFWSHLGRAHFAARQYEEAREAYRHVGTRNHFTFVSMAACGIRLGDKKCAGEFIGAALKLVPDFNRSMYATSLQFKNRSDLDHLMDSVAEAGLPE
ncbi:MAG: adenylate/guanylate cyclase domain-containing protein [Rhodobacteraceae bacterium]|nr:adenylate/guanylate cyclase domain-containing protein [Paracoccaceae bacterium]